MTMTPSLSVSSDLARFTLASGLVESLDQRFDPSAGTEV